MYRTVTIEVKTKLVISCDEGTPISDIVNEMEYSFTGGTPGATILDTEMLDFEVTDSK